MTCKDNSITFLKKFGYSVVRVPKADILPLQILIKEKGILKPLGELTTILVPGTQATLPQIKRNVPAASISGQRTSNLSVGVGVSILGNLIGAMGGSKLGLDVKYENARTIAFEFQEVLEDSIPIAGLDQYLADADVNPLSRHVADLLEADEIYVTTATIKSNKFNVEAKQKNNTGVTVDVPVIQEIVGGNIAVKGGSDSTGKVTFEGKLPLVFGFQAVQLVYEDGQYKTFKHLKTGEGAVGGVTATPGVPVPKFLASEGAFVSVDFH